VEVAGRAVKSGVGEGDEVQRSGGCGRKSTPQRQAFGAGVLGAV
jgi:hypothetical protein